jgi:hypothetical protein
VAARDAGSAALAAQAENRRAALDQLVRVGAEGLRQARDNAGVAAEVIRFAKETERREGRCWENAGADAEIGAELRAELETAREQVRASRRKWRIMKATASAIVAGSGVDWARDEELRTMVLDEDEDGV